MIFINLKKFICTAISAVTILSCAAFSPVSEYSCISTAISASAASSSKPVLPTLKVAATYSNKIEISVTNLTSYNQNTKFIVFVNGRNVSTYSYASLKNNNRISVLSDGAKYLSAKKNYTIGVKAFANYKLSSLSKISATTGSETYYKIPTGSTLYKLSGSRFVSNGKTTSFQGQPGTLVSSKGVAVAGKLLEKYDNDYLMINAGTYKGKYVKLKGSSIYRCSKRTAQIQTVVSYASGMNGGRYVWAGTSYGATDCSGLTMQSYAQVGKNISHSVRTQATLGKAVSLNNIQPGDLIICNNYGHVAMYIGNNKIVHAMSYYYGIRIQALSNIRYCGAINTIRRII